MPTNPNKRPKRKSRRSSDLTIHDLLGSIAHSLVLDLCEAAHGQGRKPKPRNLLTLKSLAKELLLPPWCHESVGGEIEVNGNDFGMPGKMLRLRLGIRLDHHPVSTPAKAEPAPPN